jgi:putative transposase
MDFVHDQLATRWRIRVLTVVDTFLRYAPVIDPRFSYRGEDVVQVLDKVCARIGYPATIRVDQGTEFVSRDLDLWAYTRGVILDFPASRLTMRSSRPSTAASGLNASISTGS